MDIFVDIKCDSIVQINEKIRFDFTKSFVPKPYVTATDIVFIQVLPTPGGTWIPIHDATGTEAPKLQVKDWYFDWVYTSARDAVDGVQTFSVKFTSNQDDDVENSIDVILTTPDDDNLFSNDNDLIKYEPDILRWLPDGRSTWNYLHRRAQDRILSYLFEHGYKNSDGSPFTKSQILEKYDVKEWSTFLTLKLIFGSITNSKDDVFLDKMRFYENLEGRVATTNIRVDINSDGIQDASEVLRIGEIRLVRR